MPFYMGCLGLRELQIWRGPEISPSQILRGICRSSYTNILIFWKKTWLHLRRPETAGQPVPPKLWEWRWVERLGAALQVTAPRSKAPHPASIEKSRKCRAEALGTGVGLPVCCVPRKNFSCTNTKAVGPSSWLIWAFPLCHKCSHGHGMEERTTKCYLPLCYRKKHFSTSKK